MSNETKAYLKPINDAIATLEESLEILNADIKPDLESIKAFEADKEAYQAVIQKFGELYASEQSPPECDPNEPDDYERKTHGY
tara:strand:- start:2187 stop:2435 length:249 start_codon:yes stop_codon:yes gene_type:complete